MERKLAQFCAHCTISARLVNCIGNSCYPAMYSSGPVAITSRTGLQRVPGTWVCCSLPLRRGMSFLLVD